MDLLFNGEGVTHSNLPCKTHSPYLPVLVLFAQWFCEVDFMTVSILPIKRMETEAERCKVTPQVTLVAQISK